MIDYHKTETVKCALFVEAESGIFDRYEVAIEVTPDVAISRYIAFEVEKSKSKTLVFQTPEGRLPVQGQFLCIPHDIDRQTSDIFAYERKMYPKTMLVDVSYQGSQPEPFHVRAKYRDSLAKTRVSLAIENSSIVPLYDIQSVVVPLRGHVFHWEEEFKGHILIARIWNNKTLHLEEVVDEMIAPKPSGEEPDKPA
jgi:hypothetical protein